MMLIVHDALFLFRNPFLSQKRERCEARGESDEMWSIKQRRSGDEIDASGCTKKTKRGMQILASWLLNA